VAETVAEGREAGTEPEPALGQAVVESERDQEEERLSEA